MHIFPAIGNLRKLKEDGTAQIPTAHTHIEDLFKSSSLVPTFNYEKDASLEEDDL